jgi:hypothetical protein
MSHGPLTWFVLGAAVAMLFTAPAYYWKGQKDGRAAILRDIERVRRRFG